jgi:hypothetical protein
LEDLERKIESGQSTTLGIRIDTGQADLLDYLTYLEQYRDLGDDMLEPVAPRGGACFTIF